MADDRKVLHEFKRNQEETLRVSLSTFKGRTYIDIRTFYEDANGELASMGFANIAATVTSGMPIGASASRSAATEAAETPALTLFSGHGLEALLHIETRGGSRKKSGLVRNARGDPFRCTCAAR